MSNKYNDYFKEYRKNKLAHIYVDVPIQMKNDLEIILKKHDLKKSVIVKRVFELLIEEDENILKILKK